MGLSTRSHRKGALSTAFAIAVGLAIRLAVVAAFPYEAGDTPLYEALAKSLDAHGAYAIEIDGRLVPVNVRMPGYPAFLAASHALFGPGFQPVRVAQAVIDVLTCVLAGLMAALLATTPRKRIAFVAALWLAALCPFTANYAAAILAETPGAFWNAACFVLLLLGLRSVEEAGRLEAKGHLLFLGAGLASGLGCYFRPETPLALMAAGVVLAIAWRRRSDWGRLLRVGIALGFGLALALGPWLVRNTLVLGRPEVLPPPGANLPGEMAADGFNRWAATWLTTNQQIYDFSFKVEDEPLEVDKLPASAYDSPAEKAEVARLFAKHNADFTYTQELEDGFNRLAAERTARHPLRTYLTVPLRRVVAMWLSARLELLPYSGILFPIGRAWEDDPVDFSVTVGLALFNLAYIVLGLTGLWHTRWRLGAVILAVYLLLRTALITEMPGPEPRYVVIAFPLLAALGAQLWAGRDREQDAPSV